MAEYIEREAAVKIAEKYGTTNGSVLGKHSGVADCIAAMIDAMPAADVAPVVHGGWKQDYFFDEPVTRCSACGVGFAKGHRAERFPYCPNCGAKMDGEA